MGTEMNKCLSWEIDNFSERNDALISDPFSSGGCEWYLAAYPKGIHGSGHLTLFLGVGSRKPWFWSLDSGWKRRVICCVALLNQSGKELYRSPHVEILLCAETPNRGPKTLPITKLQEKGFLENDKLTVEVYMKVVEVVHRGESTENEVIVIRGFHILVSQIDLVYNIFEDHPDFAVNIIPKNQGVRTAYMNLLLGLDKTLKKSPESLSVTELTNAQSELIELTEAGFKLDWLKLKLEELSLERKKALSDGSWVQQLEQQVKNLELTCSDLKVELDKEKIKSAAVAKVCSFQFIDFFIKKFFLSCFSISKQ